MEKSASTSIEALKNYTDGEITWAAALDLVQAEFAKIPPTGSLPTITLEQYFQLTCLLADCSTTDSRGLTTPALDKLLADMPKRDLQTAVATLVKTMKRLDSVFGAKFPDPEEVKSIYLDLNSTLNSIRVALSDENKGLPVADKKNLQGMLTKVEGWLKQPIDGVKAIYETGAAPSLYADLSAMRRKISPLARSMEQFLKSAKSPSTRNITPEQLINKLLRVVSKFEQLFTRAFIISKKLENAPPGPASKNISS